MFECLETRVKQGKNNLDVELRISKDRKSNKLKKKEKIEIIVNSRENKKFYDRKRDHRVHGSTVNSVLYSHTSNIKLLYNYTGKMGNGKNLGVGQG